MLFAEVLNILIHARQRAFDRSEMPERTMVVLARDWPGWAAVPLQPTALAARLNQGRWIVDCPDCAGAEEVAPGELFMCCGEFHNKRFRVTFPRHYESIETLMANRPMENRNWAPGETLADLRAENKAHGVSGHGLD